MHSIVHAQAQSSSAKESVLAVHSVEALEISFVKVSSSICVSLNFIFSPLSFRVATGKSSIVRSTKVSLRTKLSTYVEEQRPHLAHLTFAPTPPHKINLPISYMVKIKYISCISERPRATITIISNSRHHHLNKVAEYFYE
jgi:hypothetical protein